MNKSDTIASLSKALVLAQSQFKHVPMNSVNPFFKSKYADLGAVIEASKPVLKANGLAVSQLVEGEGGQVGVTTILIHESGEFISSTVSIPVEGNNIAQESGKAITYLRRYGLASILGMYADEDSDANKSTDSNKSAVETFAKESGAVVIDQDRKYKHLSAEVVKMVAKARGLSNEDAAKALNELRKADKIPAEGIMEVYQNAIK